MPKAECAVTSYSRQHSHTSYNDTGYSTVVPKLVRDWSLIRPTVWLRSSPVNAEYVLAVCWHVTRTLLAVLTPEHLQNGTAQRHAVFTA